MTSIGAMMDEINGLLPRDLSIAEAVMRMSRMKLNDVTAVALQRELGRARAMRAGLGGDDPDPEAYVMCGFVVGMYWAMAAERMRAHARKARAVVDGKSWLHDWTVEGVEVWISEDPYMPGSKARIELDGEPQVAHSVLRLRDGGTTKINLVGGKTITVPTPFASNRVVSVT